VLAALEARYSYLLRPAAAAAASSTGQEAHA
jgi:hypothetical protein